MDKTAIMEKVSVRFAKTGAAIFHSHHDMIRFWERAVRRASLPGRLTQGFNPRPRMVFPHALGLGVETRHEELELELYQAVPSDALAARLRAACAGVLEILSVQKLPLSRKGRRLAESSYVLANWPAGSGEALIAACSAVLAKKTISVIRGKPGQVREVDIRQFIKTLAYDPADASVLVVLFHNEAGSARLDEIVQLLAEAAACDWRDVRLIKTGMVLV